jgi:UDP-N-acetylmuramate dehydrogenase
MQLTENQPLAPFTTFGIGGPARWFTEAHSEDEIVEATGWAHQRGIRLFVLGGGSNVLVADNGFDGLVLRVALHGIRALQGNDARSEPDERWIYQVAAGEDWDHFVQKTVEDNCAGLECLAGIPGSVGGTPVQNVGAYGQEVASTITRVRLFDTRRGLFTELIAQECGFAYRRSRFNSTDRGRFIVTRVDYRLRRDGPPNLTYADLKFHFKNCAYPPSLKDVASAVRSIRQSKGMFLVEGDPDCRSAGSFFKNPSVPPDVADRIQAFATSSGVPLRVYPADNGLVKVPAAWLIEHAGFAKGHAFGGAGISKRHTLALINRGGASADEILSLARKISDAVQAKFGIRLEMEPEKVGF